VTYASETLVLKKQIKENLQIFEIKIIRRFFGPIFDAEGLRRRRTNYEINILLRYRHIVRYIEAESLAMLGHLERMHEERTKKVTRWKPISSRPTGRPKKEWEDVLQDLQIVKVKGWKTCVRRKGQWKEIVELSKSHSGLQSCYRRRWKQAQFPKTCIL
jgi:hypothetical protein